MRRSRIGIGRGQLFRAPNCWKILEVSAHTQLWALARPYGGVWRCLEVSQVHVERRVQYRAEVEEGSGLQVAIANVVGSPISGLLLDLSAFGAGARFFVPDLPTVGVGQEVELAFTSERLKAPFTVGARVANRAEEEGSRRYGFRFLDGEPPGAQLSPVLRSLFNRRSAFRVAPDPESPVEVALEDTRGGPRFGGRLADVSATGAGVRVAPEAESTFSQDVKLGISLLLPDRADPVKLMGNIRHRRLVGTEIHYGVEFDPDLTEEFSRKQAIITKYVMQRQRAMLRSSG